MTDNGGKHSAPPAPGRRSHVVHVGASALGQVAAPPNCTIAHERGPSWVGHCALQDLEYRLVMGREEPTHCVCCGRRLVDDEVRG